MFALSVELAVVLVVQTLAMSRLCRLIALLIVGVLGFHTAAMAAHTHFFPAPLSHYLHANADGASAGHHSAHESDQAADHHSASCITTQSCFPAAHAVGTTPVVPLSPAAAPLRPVPLKLASVFPDPLLRPPRLRA